MMLPLWILAVLSMAVGAYSTFTGHVLAFGPAECAARPGWLTPAAVGVALAGIALAWLTYQRAGDRRRAAWPRPSARFATRRCASSGSTTSSRARSPLRCSRFSRLVGWLDRYLVDGVLNVVSAWTLDARRRLRTMQTGRAQDYVYGVAVGLLVLILWMRWALA